MSARTVSLTILTAFLSVLFALATGEICIRLFTTPNVVPAPPQPSTINPYGENPYVAKARPYGYFYIPGSQYTQKLTRYTNPYKINSMGFRGGDYTRKPVQNKKRLAIVGDSIVEGHGVRPDQTFSSQLHERLASSGWEVLNLGVQGASPFYFAANLERYLYLNPDAVLLLLNENDLFDDKVREKMYFSLPIIDNPEFLYSGGEFQPGFARSRLYTFLNARVKQFSRTPFEKIIAANTKKHKEEPDGKKPSTSTFVVPAAQIDQRWQMSQQYLTYFLENLQSRNIDLLVSTSCAVTLVFPEIQEYTSHCSNIETRVENWAKKHKIPYISLASTVKKALAENKTSDVLIFNDYHPTPLTHRLFTDDLYQFFISRYANTTASSQPTD